MPTSRAVENITHVSGLFGAVAIATVLGFRGASPVGYFVYQPYSLVAAQPMAPLPTLLAVRERHAKSLFRERVLSLTVPLRCGSPSKDKLSYLLRFHSLPLVAF